VVSYLSLIELIIISVTIFEIFDVQILRPRCRAIRCHLDSKFTVRIGSTWVVSSVVFTLYFLPCSIYSCENHVSNFKTVHGHKGSQVIVPIEMLWMVSYLTGSESNIVSVTIFETFDIISVFP